MSFINRNYVEIVWAALNTAGALMNLWFALWSNLWPMHIAFVGVHLAIVGFYGWAIFDNAKLDALEAEADELLLDLETAQAVGDEPYLADEVRRTLNDEVSQ